MNSTNQFSQELQSASQQENSSVEELSDLELDDLAGGCSDGADRARAAGIPVLTISEPPPFKPRLTIPTTMLPLL